MASISFKKVTDKPTTEMTVGDIYFVTNEHTIYVATSATTSVPYSGMVHNVEYDKGTSILTITKYDGTKSTIDFSDCASATDVTNMFNNLNIDTSDYVDNKKQPQKANNRNTYLLGGVCFNAPDAFATTAITIKAASNNKLKISTDIDNDGVVEITGISTTENSNDIVAANKGYVDAIKCEFVTEKGVKYIKLSNTVGGNELGKLDCTEFLKDKFLAGTAIGTADDSGIVTVTINDATYTIAKKEAGHTYIVFLWKTDTESGVSLDALDATTFVNTYTAGDGLSLTDNAFSVNVASPIVISDDKITLKTDGNSLTTNSDGALVVNTDGILSIVPNKNIVGDSDKATTNVSKVTNNPFLNHVNSGRVKSSVQIKGGGATTVETDATGEVITISSTDTDTNTHYKSIEFVSNSSTGAANASAANGSVYLNLFENTSTGDTPLYSLQSSHKIVGGQAVSVTSADGAIIVSSVWSTWS